MQPIVTLKNVTKTYRINQQSKNVLEDISLEIWPQEFILLRGDNGSGKTTLVNLIAGLQSPDKGEITVFRKSPRNPDSRLQFGIMLQRAKPVENLKVYETINLFRSYYPQPLETQDVLKRTRLTEKQNDEATTLAGGQAQSLYFALAIVGNPDLLVLDEPTNNLSVEARQNFWQQVREFYSQGKTIIVISHSQQDCDELQDIVTRELKLSLDNGRVEETILKPEKYESIKSPNSQEKINSDFTESANTTISSINLKALWGQFYVEMLQVIRKVDLVLVSLSLAILLGFFTTKQVPSPEQFRAIISMALAGLVLFISVNQFCVKIASERDRGWLKLLRITPLSFSTYLAAKVGTFLVLVLSSITFAVGTGWLASVIYHREIGFGFWLINLTLTLLLGVIPFAIIGFCLGYFFKSESLQWVTLILIAFAGFTLGLDLDTLGMPQWSQDIIPYSPIYHYTQLIAWVGHVNILPFYKFDGYSFLHIQWLLWWTVVGSLLARWVYFRERLSG